MRDHSLKVGRRSRSVRVTCHQKHWTASSRWSRMRKRAPFRPVTGHCAWVPSRRWRPKE